MRKEDAIAILNRIESSLRKLRTEIQRVKTTNVNRNTIKDSANQTSTKWFEEIEPSLSRFGVTDEVRGKYHGLFTSLLQLSTRTSVKATYLKTIDDILRDLKDDIFVTVMKSAGQIVSVSHLAKILETATEEEKGYLEEALGCASQGYFRASIVLGWSAAVHRIHKAIEKFGFDEFTKKSEELKPEGRFKGFKKTIPVHSLGDLRLAFDNDVLWVLDYMGWIDPNQHERLSICFTMRNNSAHPGEAPITEENLASFYSDLKIIVFDNPKFKL